MSNLTELAYSFLDSEFYWSALLISQSSMNAMSNANVTVNTNLSTNLNDNLTNTIVNDNYLNIYYSTLKSLANLGFNKKLQKIIQLNKNLLKINEIKLLYLKSGKETEIESSINLKRVEFIPLNKKSVELFYTALSKKELLRKRLFIQSFLEDKRNIEPVIFLYKESLCNINEINNFINIINDNNIKEIMKSLVSGELVKRTEDILCPLLFCSMNYKILFEYERIDESSLIFRVCAKNLEFFEGSEFLFIGMGMYYLVKEKYKEAMNCFYKAVELNDNCGPGYLLAGICHSRLKETEYSVKILNNAYCIMSSSYIPSYCIAYEYQIMNNINKAKYYFKRSINLMEQSRINFNNYDNNGYNDNINNTNNNCNNDYSNINNNCNNDYSNTNNNINITNIDSITNTNINIANNSGEKIKKYKLDNSNIDIKVIYSFIYCLIYNEEYEEAMKYIDLFDIKNILKVFCLLFVGRIEDSRIALEECEKNGCYYVCKGFIYHLVHDLENAIENYEKSLEFGINAVIENLLNMAYENKENSRPNRAFDYSNCLFESFGFKKRIF